MAKEVNPQETTRAKAFEFWMKAPNPMVTFLRTLDVTNLVRISAKRQLKFNMLLDFCIGKAAAAVKEFYVLPVGDKLMQYDTLAVNTIVKNKTAKSARAIFCSPTTWKLLIGNILNIRRKLRRIALTAIYLPTA